MVVTLAHRKVNGYAEDGGKAHNRISQISLELCPEKVTYWLLVCNCTIIFSYRVWEKSLHVFMTAQ